MKKKTIIIWGILILLAKVVRDIDVFRWSYSWLSSLPIIKHWHSVPGVFDPFHLLDGFIIMSFFFSLFYGHYTAEYVKRDIAIFYSLLWTIATWFAFYGLFNLFYHFLMMKGLTWTP